MNHARRSAVHKFVHFFTSFVWPTKAAFKFLHAGIKKKTRKKQKKTQASVGVHGSSRLVGDTISFLVSKGNKFTQNGRDKTVEMSSREGISSPMPLLHTYASIDHS